MQPMTVMNDEVEKFAALKHRLVDIWGRLRTDPEYAHTSLIVPSLSVNQEELAKVLGSPHYEERLLFALIRLKNPNARVIYVTSQPLNPDIVDYYLQLLEGVTVNHARQRLQMVSVYDGSARPLTEKILERPRLLERLRRQLGDLEHAYLTCYNCTDAERRLAVALRVPLNGVDPDLLRWGTKSGSRELFIATGVGLPAGFENLRSADDVIGALIKLAQIRPSVRRAVVKLDEGFAGEGNGVFTYPAAGRDRSDIDAALRQLKWSSRSENYKSFMRKFEEMGGIVEEMIEADEVRSPSVQMRIHPDGVSSIVSSHEQILGGSTGQVYLGCRFPAREEYRSRLLYDAEKIGRALSNKGVIGRFSIDFLVSRQRGGEWASHAIEINLRMSGTTPPFHALEFLTGGELERESGLFLAPDGQAKYYSATDNLKSPAYRGLLPEDLFRMISRSGMGFRHATDTGTLFYMIGALSQYGKLGMTCVGNTAEEAQDLFDRTVELLDAQAEGGAHGVPESMFDRYLTME
jgi:hypothetical protein